MLAGARPVGLISDTWDADELFDIWWPDVANGMANSPYPAQSINAHFTHYQAIRANFETSSNVVTASLLYHHPFSPVALEDAYQSNRLGYSVGCH